MGNYPSYPNGSKHSPDEQIYRGATSRLKLPASSAMAESGLWLTMVNWKGRNKFPSQRKCDRTVKGNDQSEREQWVTVETSEGHVCLGPGHLGRIDRVTPRTPSSRSCRVVGQSMAAHTCSPLASAAELRIPTATSMTSRPPGQLAHSSTPLLFLWVCLSQTGNDLRGGMWFS